MKIVVDNSTVAHLWANKIQETARTSNNSFKFYNDTIYSYGYHFPIAKHVTNAEGKTAVLFTTRSYSNTTAKQINITRYACNHLLTIFCYNPEFTPEQNFAEDLKEAFYIAQKLTTARKPEKYLSEISSIKYRVEKYADFLNVEIPAALKDVFNIENKEQYFDYTANKEANEKKAAEAKKRKELQQHKKDLKRWENLEINTLYNRPTNLDYLRINGEIVETSQKIKMSIAEAKNLQTALKNNLITVGMQILTHYTVRTIDKKIVEIGCHRFERKYLENFAL